MASIARRPRLVDLPRTCPSCGSTFFSNRRGATYCSNKCVPRVPGDPVERFWSKVIKTDGCWLWAGGKDWDGYGIFGVHGKSYRAHRYAYELLVAPIPRDLQLDHLCRTPSCVNPAHLEAVTPRVNSRRSNSPSGVNAKATHCVRGHPFDRDNTKWVQGKRQCRTCARMRDAQRREEIRGWEREWGLRP